MKIKLKNISKEFDDKVLFDKINLTINQGEFVVIKGRSGSGKTTLANLIGGMEQPTTGHITYSPKPKNLYRNDIGFIFQNYGLLENKTIYDNLSIAFTGKKITNEEMKTKIANVLNKLNIDVHMYKKVKVLSGGERQRVAIARILLKSPNVIIADEPTGNLDRANSKIIFNLLVELHKQGKTIILVTHENFKYHNAIEYYI